MIIKIGFTEPIMRAAENGPVKINPGGAIPNSWGLYLVIKCPESPENGPNRLPQH
jgi:hypothetical protein